MSKKIIFYNVGLPTIMLIYPPMILCLLPIVFIEAYTLYKNLPISFQQGLTISNKVNFWSSIIGIPIAWLLLFLFFLLTESPKQITSIFSSEQATALLFSPFLLMFGEDKIATIFGILILLFLFWFMSLKIETYLIKKSLSKLTHQTIHSATMKANSFSYIFLFIAIILLISYKTKTHILIGEELIPFKTAIILGTLNIIIIYALIKSNIFNKK